MSALPRNKMFPKTETEYNMKSIRFLLLTITTMFIIVAGLMIVLGLTVYSRYHSFSFLYESAKAGRLFTPSILVVLLGMAMLVVTSFGFFGSLKQSTCMVNLYAFILFLVFIVELAVVCVSFTTNANTVMQYVNIPVQYYTTDSEMQAEMDFMQYSLNCCGSNSHTDYIGQEFTANHSTVIATSQIDGDTVTLVLPETCCSTYTNGICSRIRPRGCKTALANLIVQNANVIGVLGVSIMFIQVLGITFSLLLARCIRKLKSERALMRWKICEQTILARQTEMEKNGESPPTIYIEHPDSSRA